MYSPLGTSVVAKVGPKGQIVIPKEFRDRLGIRAGSTVFVDLNDDGIVTVEFAWNDIGDAPQHFARYPVQPGMEGKTALDILAEMDRAEEEIWERKYGSSAPPSPSTPTPSSPGSG